MMYHEKMEKMKLSEIKKLQLQRIKKSVKHCYDNVPLYKRRLKEAGIMPSGIKKLEDVSKLPFTVKTDLRDHYPYGILAVPTDRINRFHASSGTTGKPTVVSYTRKDLDDWYELMARCYACTGATSKDIVQNSYGYGLFTGGLGFHGGAERLGCAVIPVATGNTKRQLMIMKDMQSTVLCCTPSYALYLAEAAKADGIDPKKDLAIKRGIFGAEPWSDGMRREIQKAFGMKAYDMYGMSELYGPGVAIECEEQDGLHLWSDYFYAEVIDPETQEVLGPGEKGELVVTTLIRESMPLIRYRTRDITILNEDKCACGRSHPRIMRIGGRSDDMLIVGGVNVFPSQIEHVITQVPGASPNYQIVIDRDLLDKLTIKIETDERTKPTPELQRALQDGIQSILGIKASVELGGFNSLPRSEGKAKRVIDLRKEKA
ncbi:MAG: phenylacetate--CoA ligase [archaeon]